MATKNEFSEFWPNKTTSPPSDWTVPLQMTDIGKLVDVQSLDRNSQLFRSQNWTAEIRIPGREPEWITTNFSHILQEMPDDCLVMEISRFVYPSAESDRLDSGSWVSILCSPHFRYVPCIMSGDGVEDPEYKRLAWIADEGIGFVSEEESGCSPVTPLFATVPPFITFCGYVDTKTYPMSPSVSDVNRNSSAVFKVWSRFAADKASHPGTGWYPNHVYAMYASCKPHLKNKCEEYKADRTPFRQHGKKAYVTGYFRGFCNKGSLFAEPGPTNPLVFVPLIEIINADWVSAPARPGNIEASSSPRKAQQEPKTPSKGDKVRSVFNPFSPSPVRAIRPMTKTSPASVATIIAKGSEVIEDLPQTDGSPQSVSDANEVTPATQLLRPGRVGSARLTDVGVVLDLADVGQSPARAARKSGKDEEEATSAKRPAEAELVDEAADDGQSPARASRHPRKKRWMGVMG
ncbi:hypothetical protein CPLU01_15838 [Colletotrichum plurivorum]|uniref:Uncharacterized protein n=1 Tax=Colletotrichum plurivorum TaxID=2175906 RepID=A0A8H6J5V5_9PEZI|nr:hypothetical protein CPLU01_15838 [Colletotrichum plurivorum]